MRNNQPSFAGGVSFAGRLGELILYIVLRSAVEHARREFQAGLDCINFHTFILAVRYVKSQLPVRFQACVRGFLVRLDQQAQNKAAVSIQACARGSLTRADLSRQGEAEAAIKLQANTRGFFVRKKSKEAMQAQNTFNPYGPMNTLE